MDYYLSIIFLLLSCGIFFGVVFLRGKSAIGRPKQAPSELAILVEGGNTVDCSVPMRLVLGRADDSHFSWTEIHAALSLRFPTLSPEFSEALKQAPATIPSRINPGDTGMLELQRFGNRLRLSIKQSTGSDLLARYHLSMQENASLRAVSVAYANAPFAAWTLDSLGNRVWQNAIYTRPQQEVLGSLPNRPDAVVIEVDPALLTNQKTQRVSRPDDTEFGECWYEVSMREAGGFRTFFAVEVTTLVRAERAQRNFVQTLTKTFAQLGTGLAIFNRDRQLILFNPALIELTNMSAEFLSSRPSLVAFFDWLREARFMPEPRDYDEWRDKLTELTEAAAQGTFSELWSLPNGLSFRVFGRPHPDGAIAFLFEDVTAELSLTRNFVKELEINHSLLNSISQSVAVFTSEGDLLFVNDPFRKLWGVEDNSSIAPTSVDKAVAIWSAQCLSTPEWEVIKAVLKDPHRAGVEAGRMTMKKGPELSFMVGRLAKGAAYISFDQLDRVGQEFLTSAQETR